jgi:hypothetical protein
MNAPDIRDAQSSPEVESEAISDHVGRGAPGPKIRGWSALASLHPARLVARTDPGTAVTLAPFDMIAARLAAARQRPRLAQVR